MKEKNVSSLKEIFAGYLRIWPTKFGLILNFIIIVCTLSSLFYFRDLTYFALFLTLFIFHYSDTSNRMSIEEIKNELIEINKNITQKSIELERIVRIDRTEPKSNFIKKSKQKRR